MQKDGKCPLTPQSQPQSPGAQNESSVSISVNSPRAKTPNSCENSVEYSRAISPVELPGLEGNGRLDWSGKGLDKLPRQKCAELSNSGSSILALDISRNSLRSIDCAKLPLDKCEEIDASQNELSQLRSFHPLAQTLVHLNLSDNRVNSLGSLNSFIHLRTLDLSHNRIEHIPQLDQLASLAFLNLNSNHLKEIPNLSRLEALVELSLHGNSIRSLVNINTLLPKRSLRFLDVGGNLVGDLTEMACLHGFGGLESLTVLGNSCTRAKGRDFSYRPFLYSCVLGELKLLDGSCLGEQEIIKGEWLHAQGRTRSFRPGTGAHNQLCAYLSSECPLVPAEVQITSDDKLKAVIQKRREYRNKPTGEQTRSQPVKPSNSAAASPAAASSTPSKPSPITSPARMVRKPAMTTTSIVERNSGAVRSPLASRFNTQAQKTPISTRHPPQPVSTVINARSRLIRTEGKTASPSHPPARSTPSQQDVLTISSSSTASSHLSSTTVTLSRSEAISRRDDVPQIVREGNGHSQASRPCQAKSAVLPSPQRQPPPPTPPQPGNAAATATPLSPLVNVDNANTNALLDVTLPESGKKMKGCFRSVLSRKLRRSGAANPTATSISDPVRLQLVQKKVDQMARQNSMLTAINEDHVRTFQELTRKIQQMERLLAHQIGQVQQLHELLVPTPHNLKWERRPEDGNVLITWENTLGRLVDIATA